MICNTTGRNTAIGSHSLSANITGNANTAVGVYSMLNNVVGANNTAVGHHSLLANIADNNTAVGFHTLRCNTTGNMQVAVGFGALCVNTTGRSNVALGANTLISNTVGRYNVAIAEGALSANTSGACNVGIGINAANNITTGVNNIIAVGSAACTSATSNHTVWGNSANSVCNCVYAAWSNVSDCRDKTNIQTLSSKMGLDLIKKLRPVAFNWDHRDTYVRECSYEYGEKDGTLAGTKEHYGLIAQELKSVLDELNVRFDGLGHDDEKDAYRLTYEELIAPIIKAIQELDQRLTTVEEKVG
jgi:hypothetical protein